MRHACLILLLAVASATRPDSQFFAAEPTLEQLKTDLRSADVKVRRKAASELGKTKSREAVQYVHTVLREGTSADRQLAVYRETGDLKAVVQYVVDETRTSIDRRGVART